MAERIMRSPVQALYKYMPDQPYSWAKPNQRIGARGGNPNAISDLDVSEDWVKPQLARIVEPFVANGTPGAGALHDLIDRGQFRLVVAHDLTAHRFPNTFHCRKCNYFVKVGTDRDPAPCPNCKLTLQQFSWVYVHICGDLREMQTPQACPRGHRSGWRLTNWQQRGAAWVWRCMQCDTPDPRNVATQWCRCGTGPMSLRRANAQELHYNQQLSVLNPPTRAEHAAFASDHLHNAAVAQALGILEPGKGGLRKAGVIADTDSDEILQTLAARFNLEPDDPLLLQLAEKAKDSSDQAPWLDAVDSLGLSEERLRLAGEECLQLALARDADPLTLTALRNTEPPERVPAVDSVRAVLADRYSIGEVTLLRRLPVATIVAGYTRMTSSHTFDAKQGLQPVEFKLFPTLSDNRVPMYGARSDTEGLLFDLDPKKVIAWLVANGLVVDPRVSDQMQARRWLLANLEPVTDPFNPPDDILTWAVLTLTHSVSHRMMKAMSARCGLNIDSLAEYLFPLTASFLIYANKRSSFTLGGLEHVFRNDLEDALADLTAETRCLFDPVCRSLESACNACLHVSEISCQRFNSALSRKVLFGGPDLMPAGGSSTFQARPWTSFWTP